MSISFVFNNSIVSMPHIHQSKRVWLAVYINMPMFPRFSFLVFCTSNSLHSQSVQVASQ